MCGISGILGPLASRERVAAMVRAQHHRGPDGSGLWVRAGGAAVPPHAPGAHDPRPGPLAAGVGGAPSPGAPPTPLVLGHNRLAILDLSPAGLQPMASPDGRLRLVFNGEIYNYLELKAELEGWPWRSATDSEVILAAYDRWGEACVERFVGMFAFALWDEARGRLFCARDRLGIKPLHWCRAGDSVLFASEVKGLLAAGVPAEPDLDTWAVYLTHGVYDHSDATFFQGVGSLAPGRVLTVDLLPDGRLGPVATRPYWDLADLTAEVQDLPDAEAETRLLERFDDAVRLRLRSDVPLGVNLSGGLDSASLTVTVDGLLAGTAGELETFTASWDDPRYDEVEFAERVPRRLRWRRNVRRLAAADVWPLAADAVWHQEAPFGGISTLAYHHLHGLAVERGVTVLLEGQGVDELLAGYRYFAPHHHRDLLEAGARGSLRAELAADGRHGGDGRRGAAARLRRLLDGGAPRVYQDGTEHLRPTGVAGPLRERAGTDPAFPRPYPDHLRNALYRDLRHTKLPRVLRMNDRLSMAWSRELREPFLDHRVVELLFRLPGHQKLRRGRTKEVLRRAMAGRLPDPVRGAPKRAVVSPQREWLRGRLGDDVARLVRSGRFRERGLFDHARLPPLLAAFREGEGGNAFFVWQWVNAELWFRRFVDGEEAPRLDGEKEGPCVASAAS